jgi:hypothetical protein
LGFISLSKNGYFDTLGSKLDKIGKFGDICKGNELESIVVKFCAEKWKKITFVVGDNNIELD